MGIKKVDRAANKLNLPYLRKDVLVLVGADAVEAGPKRLEGRGGQQRGRVGVGQRRGRGSKPGLGLCPFNRGPELKMPKI